MAKKFEVKDLSADAAGERQPGVMQTVTNEDGESGKRARLKSEEEAPAPVESKDELAHKHLDALAKFVSGKKDDRLGKDYKMHIVHVSMIRELAEKKAAKRGFHLSDGTREMLKLQHDRLCKYFK